MVSAVGKRWQSGLFCGLLGGLLLALLSMADALPAEDEAKAAALPADLANIPSDALVVVSGRVADLWQSDLLKTVRGKLPPDMANAIKEIEKHLGLSVDQVERLSLVLLGLGDEQPLLFIRTAKPYDRKKLSTALGGEIKEENIKGRTILGGEKGVVAILDAQSFVVPVGGRDTLLAWLKRAPQTNGALAGALRLASGKHSVTVGLNVKAFNEAVGDKLPGEAEVLKPLLQANNATLTFDLGQESRVAVALDFASEKDAEAAAKPSQAGLALLGSGLEKGIAQLSKMEDAANIVKLLKQGEGALKAAKIEPKGKMLQATAEVKLDMAATGVALLHAVHKVREAAARAQSVNNLKQLALAMHNYHDTYNSLPPQATYDKNGKPMLSWRVMILPFIEGQNLYNQFHLDEPWDSEHNKKLLAQMPKTYASPGDEKGAKDHATHYLGFVGKGAFFEDKKRLRFADFFDGTSNTIMLVEAAKAVPWTKPEDLPYDAAKPLPKLGLRESGGFLASMCDGSVRFIAKTVKETTLRNAITRNDGNPLGNDF